VNRILSLIFHTAVFNVAEFSCLGGQKRVGIACMKKLRADDMWELPVSIRSKIFCIPFWCAIM